MTVLDRSKLGRYRTVYNGHRTPGDDGVRKNRDGMVTVTAQNRYLHCRNLFIIEKSQNKFFVTFYNHVLLDRKIFQQDLAFKSQHSNFIPYFFGQSIFCPKPK